MTHKPASLFTPVLIGGCILLMVNFIVRAAFGVFQVPIANEFGWPRAEFSLAIAFQNLAWGIGQPIFGALAEKIGDRKAIIIGALMYAGGMVLSAYATTPAAMQAYEWLVGFGIAGTGFGVVLAVVGRAAAPQHRSMALAIATAAGSLGQVFGAPLAEGLLAIMPWQGVFITFAAIILGSLICLPMLRAPAKAPKVALDETLGQILARAMKDPSYAMIFLGFFSCGYQLAFVTAHFPAYIMEACAAIVPGGMLDSIGIATTSALGAISISVIGVFNILGTLAAGWLGGRYSKKYLLAGIYLGRTIVAAWFIMTPMTPTTVIVFSALMGAMWLATVPLTSGLVAEIWGVRYMGTLYGIVFFSHQLGGFLGVWLGGKMYDFYGNYDLVWWIGVGVGAFSALIHLPIAEPKRKALAA